MNEAKRETLGKLVEQAQELDMGYGAKDVTRISVEVEVEVRGHQEEAGSIAEDFIRRTFRQGQGDDVRFIEVTDVVAAERTRKAGNKVTFKVAALRCEQGKAVAAALLPTRDEVLQRAIALSEGDVGRCGEVIGEYPFEIVSWEKIIGLYDQTMASREELEDEAKRNGEHVKTQKGGKPISRTTESTACSFGRKKRGGQ